MADQNNAPERIWIKPCDPCENPYDYYVCDPRYLDGRETSYVKSIVACAGCGGGLKRQSGQFVCRDCGKAETVQEVLAPADRAAPEWQVPEQCPVCSGKSFAKIDGEQARWRCVECKTVTPPPACQQEAVTVAEASHRLIVGFMLDCNVIGHVAAAENLVRGIKDHVAALRALKGEQK